MITCFIRYEIGRRNYALAQREGLIHREDRLFLKRASAPHAPPLAHPLPVGSPEALSGMPSGATR